MRDTEADNFQLCYQKFVWAAFPNQQSQSPSTLSSNPSPPPVDGERIQHDWIDLLGHTTNVLVFSYFDSNPGKKFTRDDIRLAIESHKKSLKDYLTPRDISRIQSGKAAVDYWIDRLVENEEIKKQNSNPVLLERISSKSKESPEKQREIPIVPSLPNMMKISMGGY
mgnify:CR=1 FL=1